MLRFTIPKTAGLAVLAAASLVLAHADEPAAPEPAAAFQSYQEAANKGDAAAQYKLAGCFSDGIGVPKDAEKAANGINRAAALGNRAAIDVQRKLNGGSGDASADP